MATKKVAKNDRGEFLTSDALAELVTRHRLETDNDMAEAVLEAALHFHAAWYAEDEDYDLGEACGEVVARVQQDEERTARVRAWAGRSLASGAVFLS